MENKAIDIEPKAATKM
jgi:hypothetical protein